MEKKYPGTYKRHLVRPIVRSNAVEKLIKKKGSLSHKPGLPTARRYDKNTHCLFLFNHFNLSSRWGLYKK